MNQIWLWQLLRCFQTISLTVILEVINLVLQFWIIPHLVFTILRQCRKNVQENKLIAKDHMKLWIKYMDVGVLEVSESPISLYCILLYLIRWIPASWWGKFCLTNLIWIFQDKYFPQTVQVTVIENIDARDNLVYAIENCVDFINDHGGCTVVVWYSRG